jgi:hypothetical protein
MESQPFSIKSIVIDPEVSLLGGPVRIIMEWVSPKDLNGAVWKVFYQVDTIRKRKMFEVVTLDPSNYNAGLNSLLIDMPSIEIESIQNLTAGMLVLTLSEEAEEILGINMIVQVMQKDGQLFKTIFSPLE